MSNTKNRIAILGSTGSIGKRTIEIIKQNPNYKVEMLMIQGSSDVSIATVIEQCNLLNPKYLLVHNEEAIKEIEGKINNKITKIRHTSEIAQLSSKEWKEKKIDTTVSAIHGFAGARPTLAMISCSKCIAIANKEAIICSWSHINALAKENKCKIIPLDSEHNSIYQLIQNRKHNEIKSVTITASGGPLFRRDIPKTEITLEIVSKHPKWSMGIKNTIDSATLANKGIEVIEASLLFDLSESQIKTVIHPQAIVHAMVTWRDNTSTAFMSNPDMGVHISNAISSQCRTPVVQEVDITKFQCLEFFEINETQFEAVQVARTALKNGQASIIAFNASNEICVEKFIKGKMHFCEIVPTIKQIVTNTQDKKFTSIEDIAQFHEYIKKETKSMIISNKT